MPDTFFAAITIGFFAACVALVLLCRRL